MKLNPTNIQIDGKNLKVGIILPYFNEILGKELLKNTQNELEKQNVPKDNIKVFRTGGALELPFASKKVIEKHKLDGVIALGIVIRGETSHYDLVTENSYQGLMQVQLELNKPIIFGVLSCETVDQAKERISSSGLNKGEEFAQSLLLQTTL